MTKTGTAKYAYRGIMLDEARHFFGVDVVKNLLDIMGRLGLNKFHWHIADDQGFRIDLPDFPKLKEIASKRSYTMLGGFYKKNIRDDTAYEGCYSIKEVEEVLAYANSLGIEVIPELDMPGHSTALIAAYPELGCGGKQIEVTGNFGILENTLCMGKDSTLEFMKKLIGQLCDLFKAKTFHVGFDEVLLSHNKACPECQAKIKELGLRDEVALKIYFKNQIRDYLKSRDVQPVVYNDGMGGFDPEVICFYWRFLDKNDTATIPWVDQGQPSIIGPYYALYMDYPYARTPLKKTYNFNPVLNGIHHPENIIGLEAPLWTESVEGPGKIAFNCYYRMAALAEIAWYGEERRPYKEFMADLRANEEKLFGLKLNIPESILNPNAFSRMKNSKTYNFKDANWEYKSYEASFFARTAAPPASSE
ncbi:MAG: family 20 glycosylhydrolase [Spirochaetaceae bacterium]|nr:family 20 glycosylhydrolase [Spirochaetaceae bacterium]